MAVREEGIAWSTTASTAASTMAAVTTLAAITTFACAEGDGRSGAVITAISTETARSTDTTVAARAAEAAVSTLYDIILNHWCRYGGGIIGHKDGERSTGASSTSAARSTASASAAAAARSTDVRSTD